jgi:serine/threonine protein kinase
VNNLVGKTLGRYKLVEELGSTGTTSIGGMATVFRATNEDTGEEVALKLLPANLTKKPEYIRRFRREYKLMSGLSHPNLVSIREYDSHEGQHFYTMSFVTWPTLETVLKDAPENKLSPLRAARIGRELLDALVYVHGESIVHRDLKPANLFVSEDDRVLLADFGLAKGLRETAITLQPSFLGTIVYASPEQIDTSQNLDHRSDLYQLGLLVFLTVAGKLPYPKRDIETMIEEKCFKEGLASVRTVNAEVPEALDAWMIRATRTDPAERFQTAAEMRDALVAVIDSGALGEVKS